MLKQYHASFNAWLIICHWKFVIENTQNMCNWVTLYNVSHMIYIQKQTGRLFKMSIIFFYNSQNKVCKKQPNDSMAEYGEFIVPYIWKAIASKL